MIPLPLFQVDIYVIRILYWVIVIAVHALLNSSNLQLLFGTGIL